MENEGAVDTANASAEFAHRRPIYWENIFFIALTHVLGALAVLYMVGLTRDLRRVPADLIQRTRESLRVPPASTAS